MSSVFSCLYVPRSLQLTERVPVSQSVTETPVVEVVEGSKPLNPVSTSQTRRLLSGPPLEVILGTGRVGTRKPYKKVDPSTTHGDEDLRGTPDKLERNIFPLLPGTPGGLGAPTGQRVSVLRKEYRNGKGRQTRPGRKVDENLVRSQ